MAIRERIDEIDRTLIALWQERAAMSQEVGATRMASGGTRLVLSREREILERFRASSAPTAPSWRCCCSAPAAARCEPLPAPHQNGRDSAGRPRGVP